MKIMKKTGGHGFAERKLNPGESLTFTKSVTVDFDVQKIWSASYGIQKLVPRTLMFILELRRMNDRNTKTYNGYIYNGNVGIIIKPVA